MVLQGTSIILIMSTSANSIQYTAKEVVQKVIDFVTFKSCNEPEEKPLTPEDIVAVLESRGWEAEIVKAETIAGEFFKKFDADGDGNIDLAELRAGLNKELGVSYCFLYDVSSCHVKSTAAK